MAKTMLIIIFSILIYLSYKYYDSYYFKDMSGTGYENLYSLQKKINSKKLNEYIKKKMKDKKITPEEYYDILNYSKYIEKNKNKENLIKSI